MVILIHRQNKMEVRLKKYPLDQHAYFEQHVKLGVREPQDGCPQEGLCLETAAFWSITGLAG
jgi:hypothetical protein